MDKFLAILNILVFEKAQVTIVGYHIVKALDNFDLMYEWDNL